MFLSMLGLVVMLGGILAATIGLGAGASGDRPLGKSTATLDAATRSTPYGSGQLMAADPNGGYWTVGWLGSITAQGGASVFGSPALSGLHLAKPIVGMASTPSGQGYWLVASDGGVFSYGNASFYGSTGAVHLNQPIVGMAATLDGKGYWLVASDGGIFTFGDAKFYGSTGAMHLNRPIVGMTSTPDGLGYWLVASDGGIFTFGDAKFYGSTGAIHLDRPIIGVASTPDGQGYWLVASDGGIFTFGDAQFAGSLSGSGQTVMGIIINPASSGYTEVEGTGVSVVPPLTPIAGPTSPSTGGLEFGTSDPGFGAESASQQAADLANMASIGLRWVRVDANWSWAQPTNSSTFDWAWLDQEVASINAAGMNADLIIDDTPAWARASTSDPNWTQPASASAYGTFAGEVAARYGPMGVKAYEIWNEPNIQMFWNPAPNPTLYTSMLKDAYAAIKSVDPGATVISGGLSPAANTGTTIAPITFLQDMYADGAEGSFDALGDHAYSYPALPDAYETWSGFSQMDQTSPSLRSVMTANGDAGKQIWVTEVGAPSAGSNGIGTAAQAQEVTEAVQSAKSTPWIGEMFFYTYEDASSNPDYFGLLNAGGSPKPAWSALAAALS
jgi:Beta-galactosidase